MPLATPLLHFKEAHLIIITWGCFLTTLRSSARSALSAGLFLFALRSPVQRGQDSRSIELSPIEKPV